MSSGPLFNPRDRLRGVSTHISSDPLRFPKESEGPDKIKADAVSRFLEKTLEYKLCRISFDEYRQELITWFPLISGLGSMVMKVNVNVIVGQPLNASAPLDPELRSLSSDPSPAETGFCSPTGCAAKPPQLLSSHAQKIRSYWNSKNPHVPHPFKKLTLRTSNISAEKAFIESLDMSGKTTKIL